MKKNVDLSNDLFRQDIGLTYKRKRWGIWISPLLVLVCFFHDSMSHAADRSSLVSVQIIEAKKGTSAQKIDPKLSKIRGSLKKTFPKLHQFKLLSKDQITLTHNRRHSLKVSQNLIVHLTSIKNRRDQLVFKMEVPQKKANFKLKAKKGKLFYQAMRWKKKVYILAFKVKS